MVNAYIHAFYTLLHNTIPIVRLITRFQLRHYFNLEITDHSFVILDVILQTARIYSGVPGKVPGWQSAVGSHYKFNRCAV